MDERVKVARLSVASNTALVALKLAAGLAMGSVSVISEAIHSGLDLLAALIAFVSVRAASRPPDENHQFGHGKIENVSGVIEALLILIAAIWIIFEAAHKILGAGAIESPSLGIAVMGISALVNYLVSNALFRTARKTDSIALEADALHLRTDVYTSVGVLAGLLLLKITGLVILDPLVAIGVALLIIKASYELTRQAFVPLVDARLPREEEEAIVGIIQNYSEHFVEFHRLRSRKGGAERHVDLHLVVHGNLPVSQVHEVCDRIEADIHERFPLTMVLIHVEPCPEDCRKCSGRCNQSLSGL
ncbi:MAG: cation diffusion facilitator family transporter [Actinobacteria bacterium]|nr:cation diffusion facilitator family transporter [Actinomycetota bacterium]